MSKFALLGRGSKNQEDTQDVRKAFAKVHVPIAWTSKSVLCVQEHEILLGVLDFHNEHIVLQSNLCV